MIGFANVLRKNKQANLTEAQLEYMERISDNGKHLLGLINQVLDLSRKAAQERARNENRQQS